MVSFWQVRSSNKSTKDRTSRKSRNHQRRPRFECLEVRTMFSGGALSLTSAWDFSPPVEPLAAVSSFASTATPTAAASQQLVNSSSLDFAILAGFNHLQNIIDRDNGNLPFFAIWALTKDQAKKYGDPSPYRDSQAHMAFDRHLTSNVAGRALYAMMLGADTLGKDIHPVVYDAFMTTVLKSLHKPLDGNWNNASADNQMVTGLASDPRKYGSHQFDLTFLYNMGAGMRGALGLATLSDDPNAVLDGYNWSAKHVFEVSVHNIRKYYVYGGGDIGGARAYNWEVFRKALDLQGGDRVAGSVSGDTVKNWSNLYKGWSDPFLVYDLVKYYESTGHLESFELAKELRDHAFYQRFPLNPAAVPSQTFTHMFEIVGEMNAYSRLALVTGDADMMERVRVRYEALRGVGFNSTGWVPEYFNSNRDTGEINNTAELIETALTFAEWGWTEYYDDVERFTRGHVLPAQLLDTSWIVNNAKPKNDGQRDVANRMYGAFGFPAPYGHVATHRPSSTGAFHVDITAGAVATLLEVRKSAYEYEAGEHRVNLLFDVDNGTIKTVSPYTVADRLTITTKVAGDVRVRLPSWADRGVIAESLTQQGLEFEFNSDAVRIIQPAVGSTFHLAMPLATQWATETVNGRKITIVWQGDRVLAMSRMGTPLPFFADAAGFTIPADSGSGTVSPPPPQVTNRPPKVNAGSDQTIQLPMSAILSGTATDDDLPNGPNTLSTTWTKVSGPGNVVFGNSVAAHTRGYFSQAGTYVLRLTASDGSLQSSDEVTVTVIPEMVHHQPPQVAAGPDQTVQLPNAVLLAGFVGVSSTAPSTPVTARWSVVSGPAGVVFGNASSVNSAAHFTSAGIYVLRLTANNGYLLAIDDVVVRVEAAYVPPSPPPPPAPAPPAPAPPVKKLKGRGGR